jgi:hypothetical protein
MRHDSQQQWRRSSEESMRDGLGAVKVLDEKDWTKGLRA